MNGFLKRKNEANIERGGEESVVSVLCVVIP